MTLESLREELSSREKGRRSYLRGRLKTLRKQDLISLGEAGQLCVDQLGKEQLVDLLMEYLVPKQEGETTPQRVWRILGEFWQERTSLESIQSKMAEMCGDARSLCEILAWQLGLSTEQVIDRKRSRGDVLSDISVRFLSAYNHLDELQSDLQKAGLLDAAPSSVIEAAEILQSIKVPELHVNMLTCAVTALLHVAKSFRGGLHRKSGKSFCFHVSISSVGHYILVVMIVWIHAGIQFLTYLLCWWS